jgi:hypothetical protein
MEQREFVNIAPPEMRNHEPKMIQKVGDRGTDHYSVKDISNTIPANPMSDRGQLLVERSKDHEREDKT